MSIDSNYLITQLERTSANRGKETMDGFGTSRSTALEVNSNDAVAFSQSLRSSQESGKPGRSEIDDVSSQERPKDERSIVNGKMEATTNAQRLNSKEGGITHTIQMITAGIGRLGPTVGLGSGPELHSYQLLLPGNSVIGVNHTIDLTNALHMVQLQVPGHLYDPIIKNKRVLQGLLEDDASDNLAIQIEIERESDGNSNTLSTMGNKS